MDLENSPPTLDTWLRHAPRDGLTIVLVLLLVLLVASYLRLLLSYGDRAARRRLVTGVAGLVGDLAGTSPRRVWALARLAVQESWRRRLWAAFGVFVVVLMFALWFLDPASDDPARLYVVFVLNAALLLLLALVLLGSSFSLPNDLKNRTVQLLVTKPVRSSEVVLGRMLGFVLLGTGMLAAMGLCGYVFVMRSLDHRHEVPAVPLAAGGLAETRPPAETSFERNHAHHVRRAADGSPTTDLGQGHWHAIEAGQRDGRATFTLGAPLGQFHARVPAYGQLRFLDRQGKLTQSGINAGNIWTYRSYILGGTLQAAIWRFHDLRGDDYPQGLWLDTTLRVSRTHKGEDITQPVLASLVLRNPATRRQSGPILFQVREYAAQPLQERDDAGDDANTAVGNLLREPTIDRRLIPRVLADPVGRQLDLFGDLVADGELEVEITCLDRDQLLGMAQPDLYLLASERSYRWNYCKTLAGIWLQMLVVVCVGVAWSTFLSGPVAFLATFFAVVAGSFRGLLATLTREGATGPLESAVRIFEHRNPTESLPRDWSSLAAVYLDEAFRGLMRAVLALLPDFGAWNHLDYLASGFDVPRDVMLVECFQAIGFVIPAVVLGTWLFRAREVAA